MLVEIRCGICPAVISISAEQPEEVVDKLYEHAMLAHGTTERIPREAVEIQYE